MQIPALSVHMQLAGVNMFLIYGNQTHHVEYRKTEDKYSLHKTFFSTSLFE